MNLYVLTSTYMNNNIFCNWPVFETKCVSLKPLQCRQFPVKGVGGCDIQHITVIIFQQLINLNIDSSAGTICPH